ncbi:hypothetical protein CGCF413_v012006 [Colletotrichum fructicola]|nr:hypothetical protein CGCF413_v012006 [Colletotrichum fructicola]
MLRRYRPDKWLSTYDETKKVYLDMRRGTYTRIRSREQRPDSEMPATFIAKTNGEDQYFTVLPMWDPVYVQPRGCNPDFTRLIVDMPFFAMRNGFRGVRHLAIDFDPSWTAEELRE